MLIQFSDTIMCGGKGEVGKGGRGEGGKGGRGEGGKGGNVPVNLTICEDLLKVAFDPQRLKKSSFSPPAELWQVMSLNANHDKQRVTEVS